MIAKVNYTYYNQSDIFNTKPLPDKKTIQAKIDKKQNKYNFPNRQLIDNNKVINENPQPHQTFKKLRSAQQTNNNKPIRQSVKTPEPIRHEQKIKDDLAEVVLDTSAEARKEFKKNINRIHHDEVVLGTDEANYTTSNSAAQDYAKKQLKKARMINSKSPDISKNIPKTTRNVRKKDLHFMISNTTGHKFDQDGGAMVNKVNFQKSNIFNDPEKEKKNKTLVPNISKKEEKTPTTPVKRKIENDEVCPSVDWRYNRTDILLKRNKTSEFKNARERKLHDNKGAFPCKYDDYTPKERTSIKREKSSDDAHFKHIGERPADDFIIENIAENSKFDMEMIKKTYRKNGLHIFGERTDPLFMNGRVKGNARFKVRQNNDDNKYQEKVSKSQERIEKEQGIKIIKKISKEDNHTIKKEVVNDKSYKKKPNPKWMEIKIQENAKKGQLREAQNKVK